MFTAFEIEKNVFSNIIMEEMISSLSYSDSCRVLQEQQKVFTPDVIVQNFLINFLKGKEVTVNPNREKMNAAFKSVFSTLAGVMKQHKMSEDPFKFASKKIKAAKPYPDNKEFLEAFIYFLISEKKTDLATWFYNNTQSSYIAASEAYGKKIPSQSGGMNSKLEALLMKLIKTLEKNIENNDDEKADKTIDYTEMVAGKFPQAEINIAIQNLIVNKEKTNDEDLKKALEAVIAALQGKKVEFSGGDGIQGQMDKIIEEINEKNEEIERQKDALKKRQGVINEKAKRITELKENEEANQQQIARLEQEIEESTKEFEQQLRINKELIDRQEGRIQKFEEQLEEAKREGQEVEAARKALEESNLKLEKAKEELEGQIADLNETIKKLGIEIKRLEADVETLRADLKKQVKEVETQKALIQQQEAKLTEKQGEINDLLEEKETLRQQYEQASKEQKAELDRQLQEKNDQIAQAKEKFEQESQAQEAAIEKQKTLIEGLRRDLRNALRREAYKKGTIEKLRGQLDDLQKELENQEATLKATIKELEEKVGQLERDIADLRGEVTDLKEEIKTKDDLIEQNKQELEQKSKEIEDLLNDLGQEQLENEENKQEIQNLKQQYEQKFLEQAKLLKQKQEDIEELGQLLDEAEAARDATEEERKKIQKEKENLEDLKKTLEEQNNALQAQVDKLEDQVGELTERVKALEAELKDQAGVIQKKQEEIDQKQEELTAKQERIDGLVQQQAELQQKFDQAKATSKEEKAKLERQLQEKEAQIEKARQDFESESQKQQSKIAKQKERAATWQKRAQSAEGKLETSNENISFLMSALDGLEKKLKKQESELNATIEELQGKLKKFEDAKAKRIQKNEEASIQSKLNSKIEVLKNIKGDDQQQKINKAAQYIVSTIRNILKKLNYKMPPNMLKEQKGKNNKDLKSQIASSLRAAQKTRKDFEQELNWLKDKVIRYAAGTSQEEREEGTKNNQFTERDITQQIGNQTKESNVLVNYPETWVSLLRIRTLYEKMLEQDLEIRSLIQKTDNNQLIGIVYKEISKKDTLAAGKRQSMTIKQEEIVKNFLRDIFGEEADSFIGNERWLNHIFKGAAAKQVDERAKKRIRDIEETKPKLIKFYGETGYKERTEAAMSGRGFKVKKKQIEPFKISGIEKIEDIPYEEIITRALKFYSGVDEKGDFNQKNKAMKNFINHLIGNLKAKVEKIVELNKEKDQVKENNIRISKRKVNKILSEEINKLFNI